MLAHRAPPSGSSDELARLRADLHEADFTLERLGELLGPVAAAALHREQVLPATLALAESTDRAAVLARLFVLGLPVEGAELDRVLPRTGAAGLARTALTRRALVDHLEGEWWQATCELRPYGDGSHHWWLPSDFGEAVTRGPLPTDHVLGLGGASATLASWTPRPLVARALDLGTGCGVQALHLTTHAATVVATDVSTRALGFARLTAGLNGLRIEVRQGSLLEPVAGEVFDLIVSNPPFVITPRDPTVPQYEYRDGGRAGDALVAGLVRDIGAHLAPGGIAQLLGNWEMRPGETWRERVGSWVEGTGLDAWVVQRDEQDTAQYAETWIRDGGLQPGSPEFETLYAAWLADSAGRDVERIGFGVVTLHRPMASRHPWRHLEEVSGPVSSPLGPSLLNGLRARSWLTEHSSDELLDTAWTVAEDVTEERVGWPGAPDPTVIQLRQGGGLRRTVRLDTVTAALVGACDGDLTARQILAGVAVLLERPVGEVTAAALPLLRDLVADGLVAPAAEGETSW